MSGALWATAAGIGFGFFQALNGRAVRNLDTVYTSTFLQLLAATAVLALASLATEDLSVLGDAPAWSLIAFALAGVIHFLVAWTTLNLSHSRIGAARTSPLLSTTPLFGLVLAAVAARQFPSWLAVGGIAVTIAGAYLVADPGGGRRANLRDSSYALATACAWAVSAILTLEGLDGFDSPLLGVTLGMLAAAIAYAALLMLLPSELRAGRQARDALALKLFAGVAVGLATWARWIALDHAAVAVVLTLNLVSVPVVLLLAPAISGRHVEVVTPKIWGGAVLVMLGALLLIVRA